jgi:hypothetical protein
MGGPQHGAACGTPHPRSRPLPVEVSGAARPAHARGHIAAVAPPRARPPGGRAVRRGGRTRRGAAGGRGLAGRGARPPCARRAAGPAAAAAQRQPRPRRPQAAAATPPAPGRSRRIGTGRGWRMCGVQAPPARGPRGGSWPRGAAAARPRRAPAAGEEAAAPRGRGAGPRSRVRGALAAAAGAPAGRAAPARRPSRRGWHASRCGRGAGAAGRGRWLRRWCQTRPPAAFVPPRLKSPRVAPSLPLIGSKPIDYSVDPRLPPPASPHAPPLIARPRPPAR